MKKDIVFLGGARTPMGEYGGVLKDLTANELGAKASTAALERAGVAPEQIDHTVFGNALQTSRDAAYGARHVSLRAGIPIDRPALTVNRLCGSGVQSIVSGAQLVMLDEAKTCLVGGMESMSQAPHVIWGARTGFRLGEGKLEDYLMVSLMDGYCGFYMAQTAENLARKYEISREDQDAFALGSQKKAAAAFEAGRLTEEIVAVEIKTRKGVTVFEADDHPRPESTIEGLAKLPTAFGKDGFVTAGNASGIVDGAAALVITDAENAKALGREPIGRIVSYTYVGVEPSEMGIGPVPATKAALAKAGLTLDDMDLVEVNEAFAAQVLAVQRELGIDPEKLNVNGGAIALGHPLGASGTRLVLTLLHELRRRTARFGLATACIGGGQGIAMIVEAL